MCVKATNEEPIYWVSFIFSKQALTEQTKTQTFGGPCNKINNVKK